MMRCKYRKSRREIYDFFLKNNIKVHKTIIRKFYIVKI